MLGYIEENEQNSKKSTVTGVLEDFKRTAFVMDLSVSARYSNHEWAELEQCLLSSEVLWQGHS